MTIKEFRATIETLEAIQASSSRPHETARRFIRAVGTDTAAQCVAAMVRRLHWDGRISRQARQWAEGVELPAVLVEHIQDTYSSIHAAHLSQIAEAMPAELDFVEAETQPAAARYLEQVEQADSLDELDAIVESAANDDSISTADYEAIHSAALRKAQEWDPQNKPQEPTQQETPSPSRKRYFVKRGNFGNIYSLFWTDSPEMETKLPDGAERITRAEAIKLCRDERQRRKHDRAFAYYADAQVYPAGYPDDSDISADRRYTLSGYIWERTSEAVSR